MRIIAAKKISQGWIGLGIVGILGCFVAWFREGFAITTSANLSYIISIMFFVFAVISGIGSSRNKLWGKILLTLASILLTIYCFLFLWHVWTTFGIFWLTIIVVLFVFAISSIPLIWNECPVGELEGVYSGSKFLAVIKLFRYFWYFATLRPSRLCK